MTVKELKEILNDLPDDMVISHMHVGNEFNTEDEIYSADVEDKKWSLMQGKYLDITPKLVLR